MSDGFRPSGNGVTGGTIDPSDLLRPIDPDAPVSGHQPAPLGSHVASLAPEHDWASARPRVFPVLRPIGTTGLGGDRMAALLEASPHTAHTQPLLRDGPVGLPVAYALAATGFDVLVNGEHLLSWGVDPATIDEAAMENLAAWSAGAPWSDEADGNRRLLSSDSGEGWDASRILLPAVRRQLADELGHAGRVLVGLPERHLLLAGSLHPDDFEFGALFRDFVIEHSGGADEPIDRRVFELVGDELVEFVEA
jgi:hypothetical protein